MSTNVPEPARAESQADTPRITVTVSGLGYVVPDVCDTLQRDGGTGRVILTVAGVSFHGPLDVLRRLVVDCDVQLERAAQLRKQAEAASDPTMPGRWTTCTLCGDSYRPAHGHHVCRSEHPGGAR